MRLDLRQGAPDGLDGVGRHGPRRLQVLGGPQLRHAVALVDDGRALVHQHDGQPRQGRALGGMEDERGGAGIK